MKINIWSAGDPSVGINGSSATVYIDGMEEWSDDPKEAKEIREHTRQILSDAFKEIFDNGRVVVMYDDENGEDTCPE